MTSDKPEVGQLWADKDKRSVGRIVRIVRVEWWIEYVDIRKPNRKPYASIARCFGKRFRQVVLTEAQ